MTELTPAQRRALLTLSAAPDEWRGAGREPTLEALERRGLVTLQYRPSVTVARITPAGLVALEDTPA